MYLSQHFKMSNANAFISPLGAVCLTTFTLNCLEWGLSSRVSPILSILITLTFRQHSQASTLEFCQLRAIYVCVCVCGWNLLDFDLCMRFSRHPVHMFAYHIFAYEMIVNLRLIEIEHRISMRKSNLKLQNLESKNWLSKDLPALISLLIKHYLEQFLTGNIWW